MSKRKYKVFIDIVLILLCLMPVIYYIGTVWSCDSLLSTEQKIQIISDCLISDELANDFQYALETMGICCTPTVEQPCLAYGLTLVVMSNSVVIYLAYLLLEFMLFLPKLAIRCLHIGGYKYD